MTAAKSTPKRPTAAAMASVSSKEADTAGLIDGIVADKNLEIAEFAEQYAFTPADLHYRSFTAEAADAAAPGGISFSGLRDEYAGLWAEMAIRREKLPEVDSMVDRIVRHKQAYQAVERLTRVPWFAIAVIHNLEAGGDFNCHLHNGDPLTARTVHVPAGRPASGNPPFTWEQSAVDALQLDGLTAVTDWSVEHLAYQFENFNGWGYRLYHPHVKSPYLWSYSNHYTSGKYVGDGQWSETAVSRQCGAMVLLKRLQERGEIRLDYARPEPPADFALFDAPLALAPERTNPVDDTADRTASVEKVLQFDQSVAGQDTSYYCGPASCQIVLNSRGIFVDEHTLAREIGTTQNGTDFVGLIERVLDRRVPEANYTSVPVRTYPTAEQKDKLWRDVVRSVDAGWGVIMNWWAPPNNYPIGVKGTMSPKYHGGLVKHYVAAMGYDDTPGARALWIADSGFWPRVYWCAFDQVARLLVPKDYAYANVGP
jgi:lysozyme family protein